MNKYNITEHDGMKTIKTNCVTLYDIDKLVAEYFIDTVDDEEVTIEDETHGKILYSIYDGVIVHNINLKLQEMHFGGTLEADI